MKYTGAYVLDTSAILAYTGNEPGADTIEAIFQAVGTRQARVYISFMTVMEACYKTWSKKGEESARFLYGELGQFPAEIVSLDEQILWLACDHKARFRLSLADAWISATARKYEATLVHKDPEFEQIHESVRLLTLPYKHSH